jgi:hypothetical protein
MLDVVAREWLVRKHQVGKGLAITSRHGQVRKHHSSVAVPSLRSCLLGFTRDRFSVSPLARWWLPSNGCFSRLIRSRCLQTNVVSEQFAINGCFFGSTVLALRKCATISSGA